MKLKLLKAESVTEQLSSCRLSLILGVMSSNNLIDTFLKVSRKTLQVEIAVLGFNSEPCQWHSFAHQFHASIKKNDGYISSLFQGEAYIDQSHPKYDELSGYLERFGIEHRRLIAFSFEISDHLSVGYVVFYDNNFGGFVLEDVSLVKDLSRGLIAIIRQNEEYTELKELYEQQLALNFSKTKFFQIIAHDLRAPFHGLLGFTDVLAFEREQLDEASLQNITEYLYDTAQSTYNLLESLLNWAMAEGGRLMYHPINFELAQATHIVCNVLNGLALKKNIQLLDAVPSGIKVYADINMVTSVIQNLVSNALKFTGADAAGVVRIYAEQVGQKIFISIQDSGLGMSTKQIKNLFEPKLTVSMMGTNGEKGTGLGLILCKKFIDLNHGEISVVSKQGQGTIFKVILPAAENPHQALSNNTSLSNDRQKVSS